MRNATCLPSPRVSRNPGVRSQRECARSGTPPVGAVRMSTCAQCRREAMFSAEGPRLSEDPLRDRRKMRTLDALLYQWVGEADESRADRAFKTYYSAAFPALVRHVQHRTGWDFASAEDIAQEALLRFFERAGPGRRDAAAVVRSTAERLMTLELGPFASRPLARWAAAVTAVVNSFVDLNHSCGTPVRDKEFSASAREVFAEIASLQADGCRLLDEAQRVIERRPEGSSAVAPELPATPSLPANDAAVANLDGSQLATLSSPEHYCPRTTQLMEAVGTIIKMLPHLRIPTNGYLFEIATSTFLDELKRRRRKKRGGSAARNIESDYGMYDTAELRGHPLESIPDELDATCDQEFWRATHSTVEGHSRTPATTLQIPTDPASCYEGEEFLQQFYEYLRAPVARAARALGEAQETGRASPEKCRLDRMSRKFSRTMAVLSMMGEGYTQEETARGTGLSRNQVKYTIETVKQAYARFVTGEPSLSGPKVSREGESHVS